ncbi:head maturation protease, ClpP-related [Stenotrophomonas maltophilia]|uniref:head maturation protease, ClpP-related n=1 Tax=Stenotrophomonas maltophilia TaxID=40324 RepID=UPI00066A64F1|nr:head maturation protease, ClpP-related [Stenotrophomonas maltophilia]PZS72503.1 peptidase [Stenotrophomonas maltophilia]HDX0789759.1 Clp protease ClpP [Stenotrophomonas maltophilia]HDX0805727.1 Clp protease ClpP [Stenotrophomonas maltophilia]HDX0817925.1 Clp protease ClpP [Stenotrophomonas maltophilia]HDX0831292.1 Clp protease ClpP [Stenotrophomonas maltophilia]
MSLRQLPEIRAERRLGAAQFDVRPDALQRWEPEVRAAGNDANSISIYDSIGEDWEGTGVTAKRISAALRAIGDKDVVVNINSPGGDFFEGVAIYNLLREHQGRVTVQVMGLAASAASVIAMAGDEILMGDGSFLMIHNAWAVAIGNRHDMADAAKLLEPFDTAMAKVYAARSGVTEAEAARMMDEETWIGAAQAVEDGFADGLLDGAAATKDAKQASGGRKALALVEAAMAKAGHSRSMRRDTLKSLFNGKPCAARSATPSAGGNETSALLQGLLDNIKA